MKLLSRMTFVLVAVYFAIVSYGFLDLHLALTDFAHIEKYFELFRTFAREHRPIMAMLWLFGLAVCSVCYLYAVNDRMYNKNDYRSLLIWIGAAAVILACSYPANSYDLFNYITTAKVAFYYKENPYIVMPVEFIGEPYLAFTRAANKIALYGPIWILITGLPHYLGGGNIWSTIIVFKLVNVFFYLLFVYFIIKITGSMKNAIFFALNPLILIEVLLAGHNDISMMVFSLLGMFFWLHKKKRIGFTFFALSWFIKGMTIVLLSLFFLRKIKWEQVLTISYWIVIGVFIVIAPLREELYPWYAVWFVTIASLMNLGKNTFIYWLTIVFSLSLELRHIPYMWMGYYEGPGPMLRTLVTVIPVGLFVLVYWIRMNRKKYLSIR